MKHPRLLCLVSLIALTGGCKAEAVRGHLADMLIIDRDNGAVLTPYLYHGEYWIAGRPGSRYAVEVRNHLGERLLVVMSVDGINVVSGATAAWDQAGYVFSPGDQYQVTGWRKSDTEIAAFTFTESPNSYAERTGRPANVGVIGVALFRERAPLPIPAQIAPALEPKLGTGHGDREYSYVSHTEFVRMQPSPNEVLRIHYDSRANLIAMGIIPRGRPPAPYGNPFPGSRPSYVPDPPG
jgi:hypothetical protein